RYAATNDAIDASSSTTSTVCGFADIGANLPPVADGEPRSLRARQRLEVGVVQRVAAVARRRVGHAREPDRSLARRDEARAAAAPDEDRVSAARRADDAEREVGARPPLGGVALLDALRPPRADHLAVVAVRAAVDDDLPDADHPADHRAGELLQGDDGRVVRRGPVRHDERTVA